jgi:hypothetical protein
MSVGTATKAAVTLTPEQRQVGDKLASIAKLVGGCFMVLGIIQIAGGPAAWVLFGAGFFAALVMLLTGAVCALLGLVMLTVAGDFAYLVQLPQYSGNHLRNATKALAFFHQILLALALLVGLATLIRCLS